METAQKKVTSKDGTPIAYEQSGNGPVVILVAGALSDRSDHKRIAKLLADDFTVINYDRRGRGASGDRQPYAVAREVEDIDALIEAAGGSAILFGSSSGAALALEAAAKLSSKVKKVAMYEPPFIVDGSRPPIDSDGGIAQVKSLVSSGKNAAAVKFFYNQVMGIPAIGVFFMQLMPGWSKGKAMAHTIAYDLTVLKGTQAGKPLPSNRWSSAKMQVVVMAGSKSEKFFHTGAKAVADSLPNAGYRQMKDMHHGSVVMGSKPLAAALKDFFKA